MTTPAQQLTAEENRRIRTVLRELVAAQNGFVDEADQIAAERLQFAMTKAEELLSSLSNSRS